MSDTAYTPPQDAALGLYVHWPYCARICPYCDFNVYRARGADAEALTAAMLADLTRWRDRTGARRLSSLHFGGGTPSLMTPDAVAAVIERAEALWGFEPGAEIGLEANPKEAARLAGLWAAGIGRVSLGAQALDDADLKRLGRDHGAREALEAYDAARGLFDRVSIDLIYARENQTPEAWSEELARVLALKPDHLSLYQLTIEPGTAYAKAVQRGALTPPDADAAAEMYETSQAMTREAGLSGYEISNHARTPGDESAHNRLYWAGADWIGIGPGAHSRLGDQASGGRTGFEAEARPERYIAGVEAGAAHRETSLSALEEAQERVLMGLRVIEGLDRARLRALTGHDVDYAAAERFAADRFATLSGDRVALTQAGRLFADRIAGELAPG
mgnify:CR=1 FL=1